MSTSKKRLTGKANLPKVSPMDALSQTANARMAEKGWTRYRLIKELEGRVSKPTIYAFLNGKPVQSDTLASIMHALGLEVLAVTPEVRRRMKGMM